MSFSAKINLMIALGTAGFLVGTEVDVGDALPAILAAAPRMIGIALAICALVLAYFAKKDVDQHEAKEHIVYRSGFLVCILIVLGCIACLLPKTVPVK